MCDAVVAMKRMTDWSTQSSTHSTSENSKLRMLDENIRQFLLDFSVNKPWRRRHGKTWEGVAEKKSGNVAKKYIYLKENSLSVTFKRTDLFLAKLEASRWWHHLLMGRPPTAEPARSKVETCFPLRKSFNSHTINREKHFVTELQFFSYTARAWHPEEATTLPLVWLRCLRQLQAIWTLNFNVQANPWDTSCMWCHANRQADFQRFFRVSQQATPISYKLPPPFSSPDRKIPANPEETAATATSTSTSTSTLVSSAAAACLEVRGKFCFCFPCLEATQSRPLLILRASLFLIWKLIVREKEARGLRSCGGKSRADLGWNLLRQPNKRCSGVHDATPSHVMTVASLDLF